MVNTEAAVIQSHNCMHQYVGEGWGDVLMACFVMRILWTGLRSLVEIKVAQSHR